MTPFFKDWINWERQEKSNTIKNATAGPNPPIRRIVINAVITGEFIRGIGPNGEELKPKK